ncbi:MAG: peptidoglycan editing factor PgeF [Clostridiales bacterium]|nr:peptidoglycan editing factor PgeF [Clostridiales bacterium]
MDFSHTSKAILENDGKAPYITFPALSKIPFIKHGFSTRIGGVSKDCLSTMNLDFSREDRANVLKNFQIISDSIGLKYEDLVFSHQVHKTNVRLVTNEDKGKGIIRDRDYSDIDGLITNTPGIPLVTFYADCVPLYFVDTKNKAIGLSHSGWRGTVSRMGEETVEAMKKEFGSSPKDIVAVIGPSICKDCYEVSEDVAIEFYSIFTKDQCLDIIEKKENNKYQLDLWMANLHILLDAGLQAENIHISGVCTACNSDLLFSHRASKGKRGSLAAFLTIKNDVD